VFAGVIAISEKNRRHPPQLFATIIKGAFRIIISGKEAV
jgi:hypothetical protein